MITITEAVRQVPVRESVDVLVAGGGIAGVAAAAAAARAGRTVCLIEKTCALGGLATLGNVTVWLPLCDGCGRQVTAGLAEELLRLSVADLRRDDEAAGFAKVPECWRRGGDSRDRWRHRYQAQFNPASYLLALEEVMVGAGVRILYDTRLCAVRRSDGRVTHVIVENKGGRQAIACATAVDATGDADLCHLAGERTESLATNVLSGWFSYRDSGGLHLDCLSKAFSPVAATDGAEGPFYRGDDADEVTAHVLGSRRLIRERLARLRERVPESDVQPIYVATLPCMRMTRRLVAGFSLGAANVHTWFEDTVGLTGDWRQPGPVYAIPLRSLLGAVNRNLLAAGRCISADRTAWDVTRAIPGCALTGEAAGAAAALASAGTGGDVAALPIAALQDHLRSQGVLLDPALAAPADPGGAR